MNGSLDDAQQRASGERGQHRRPAASFLYLHGGPNRVEPEGLIHQDAMPQSYGRLKHNFFTTSREVAEDAADMRDGLGHGWIHAVEPTGDFEVDRGEPQSWKSEAPLRVISVEPARLNGRTPHPPILRQQNPAAADSSAALGELYHSTPYAGGFPHDEWTHVGTRAAAEDRIAKTNPADYEAAAERRGFFPGDDLSQMQGGKQAAWVKIRNLLPYREYDHTPQGTRSLLDGRRYHGRYTPQEWDAQVASVRSDGMREPVKIEYNPYQCKMYVGEGNHRIVWAAEAGWDAVPVWGLKGSKYSDWEHAQQVPGEPDLTPELDHEGYFPASFHPGRVLPATWLHNPDEHPDYPGVPQETASRHLAGTSWFTGRWRASAQPAAKYRDELTSLAGADAAAARRLASICFPAAPGRPGIMPARSSRQPRRQVPRRARGR